MMVVWKWARAVAFRIKVAATAWLLTAASGAALYWAFFVPLPQDAEQRLRIVGTVLQVGSIVAVGVGVGRVRKRLGKRGVWREIGRYFKTLFSYPRDSRLEAGTGLYGVTLGGVSLSATGTVTPPETPPPTLEERLTKLDGVVHALTKRINALEGKIAEEAAARERALTEERSVRTEQQGEQRRLIDELQTGDVLMTAVGLVWLLLGIVLAGVPDILAHFAVGAG